MISAIHYIGPNASPIHARGTGRDMEGGGRGPRRDCNTCEKKRPRQDKLSNRTALVYKSKALPS
jgi:hypothetical protein